MARSTRLAIVVAVALASVPAFEAIADRPCPPDTNCSGAVDVNDLLTVIAAWGSSDPIADIDDSGTVEVNDLLAVITTWGPCLFNFGPAFANAEAHQIGLEMLGAGGPLALPPATYTRIDRDLGLIRTAYPNLVGQTHTMAWAPTQFIAAIIQGMPVTEFGCLNTYYQVIDIDPLFSSGGIDYKVVTLAGKINIAGLCAIYTDLPEISFAEPNGLIGGENFWVPTDMGNGTWRWNIDDGFWDCFDGCDCHRYYIIDVDAAGVVTLISYQEIGQSWCKW